ncbi:MAG: histidinol-phosphate transaminase [Rhodobacteraceae bacterium]|nr:histidinol-phosphate transaminase [Paracoccaceae bacterium]
MSSHPDIIPQPGILDITPYTAGKSGPGGGNRVTKLSSNENPLGPSPLAKTAYKEMADSLEIYPPSDHVSLRNAIAKTHALNPENIICGAGSDEIITFLCQTYAGPGDEVLYTEHGFSMYKISALAAGATPVVAPESNRVADIDALLAACTDATKLVFLANPNNPTGTMVSDAEIARLAAGLPKQALLVLDGAYAEFVPGFDGHAALVTARDNVVMTRTFSKIYGLGGARVGWGFGPDHVIDALNRVRGPFNISAAGLKAAEAAVQDTQYTAMCQQENAKWRDWLVAELAALGVACDPSHTNFILPRFADPKTAMACDAYLAKHGLIVRNVAGYGLPEFLRISIGDEIGCRAVAGRIGEFMKGARV